MTEILLEFCHDIICMGVSKTHPFFSIFRFMNTRRRGVGSPATCGSRPGCRQTWLLIESMSGLHSVGAHGYFLPKDEALLSPL